jgi:hypothetical protein
MMKTKAIRQLSLTLQMTTRQLIVKMMIGGMMIAPKIYPPMKPTILTLVTALIKIGQI